MVIPAGLYTERHLDEEKLDRTGEFISTCGSNHFNIDTSREGFCRDSVFSITAAHNIGALPCMCDYAGSASFECEKFGGQCTCKENIIGRQCTACKSGYYGFPECKPCNCPSTAYCEPQTGMFSYFFFTSKLSVVLFCKKIAFVTTHKIYCNNPFLLGRTFLFYHYSVMGLLSTRVLTNCVS